MYIDTSKVRSVTAEELPEHLKRRDIINECYNYEANIQIGPLRYLDTDKEVKIGDYVVLRTHKDMVLPAAKDETMSVLCRHTSVLKDNKRYLEDKLILCRIIRIKEKLWKAAGIAVEYAGAEIDIENFNEKLKYCWFSIWEFIPWEVFTENQDTQKDMYEEVLKNYMSWGDV